jgi:hypothetical protein
MLKRNPPEVPPAEGSEPKEVFAFFGLCAYQAQVLEHGLLNLLVPLRLRGLTRLSSDDVQKAFVANERKTLGQLINDVACQVPFPADLATRLKEALGKRNHLIHGFFATHNIDFMSAAGRSDMIKKLRTTTLELQAVDRELEPITSSLWQRLGMTDEILEKALREMLAEANAREGSS